MPRKIILSAILVTAILAFFAVTRGLNGEDNWICQKGQWNKHGNPKNPMPLEPCDGIQSKAEEKMMQAGDVNNRVPEPIGGQKDEHGCYVAAGYSWCEQKQKCLRSWEESCP